MPAEQARFDRGVDGARRWPNPDGTAYMAGWNGRGADNLKLIVEDLAQSRGGTAIFAGLSFTVAAGEALLLTGPNGAGKTTLLRTLAGLLTPRAGRLRFEDGDRDASIGEQAHYVGHANAVKASLTVAETMTFWAAYLGGDGTAAARRDTALTRFALAGLADVPAGYLSAGQKRRLGLARLLAADRPIWLLDEPTVSLDAASREAFAGVCRAHCAGGGLIIAATHLPLGLEHARELDLGRRSGAA
jgi:heme exporter protein A